MVFRCSLSDSKFPPVSRTLRYILPDLKSAVVWMDSARSPISSSSGLLTKPLGPFWEHQLQWVSPSLSCSITFYFSGKLQILVPLFVFFNCTLWSAGTAKSTIRQVLFSFFVGLVNWSVSSSSSPLTNHLATVASAPITTGIAVTFMFHSFFLFL